MKISRLELKTTAGQGAAFVLRRFLTPSECQQHIDRAEEKTKNNLQPCGYHPSIRRTDRWEHRREDLAEQLFQRVLPFLEPVMDLSDATKSNWPGGVHRNNGMREGLWYPTELNPQFRICRYRPGGFFVPHHDGQEEYTTTTNNKRVTMKSIKTLMIYLNDSFEGGATNFYNEKQSHYREGHSWLRTDSLQPQTGDALVFNSAITHDGGKITQGFKYILRTEIMYTLQRQFEDDEESNDDNRISSISIEPDHDCDVEDFLPPEDSSNWLGDSSDDDEDIIIDEDEGSRT